MQKFQTWNEFVNHALNCTAQNCTAHEFHRSVYEITHSHSPSRHSLTYIHYCELYTASCAGWSQRKAHADQMRKNVVTAINEAVTDEDRETYLEELERQVKILREIHRRAEEMAKFQSAFVSLIGKPKKDILKPKRNQKPHADASEFLNLKGVHQITNIAYSGEFDGTDRYRYHHRN